MIVLPLTQPAIFASLTVHGPSQRSVLSRRDLLTGIAAVGAAALAQRANAQVPDAHAIDCHNHFASPAYIKALMAKEGKHVAGYTTWFALQNWKNWSPAKAVEDMDKQGTQTCMLSCTTPGAWFGNPEETKKMVREMNEFGARMVSDYPGRFGLFALLPLPTIDDSLKEIEYALDTLHADGFGLMSSHDLHWHGDVIFRPVFDELNRRNAYRVHASYRFAVLPGYPAGHFAADDRVQHRHGAHDLQLDPGRRGSSPQCQPRAIRISSSFFRTAAVRCLR